MGFLGRSFPLLFIPVAIYNLMMLATGSLSGTSDTANAALGHALGRIPMPTSGVQWQVAGSDVILVIGLVTLFFEVIASSRSANDVLLKHVLSMFLFIACLVEFLLFKPFATSTFFLLTVMVLLETIAGFIITTVAARKDIEMARS